VNDTEVAVALGLLVGGFLLGLGLVFFVYGAVAALAIVACAAMYLGLVGLLT
jgi:hypothetical protein